VLDIPEKSRRAALKEPPALLMKFVWHISGKHQIILCVLSVMVFLLATLPLELQRRLVNQATIGAPFEPLLWLAGLYLAAALAEGGTKFVMNVYRGWVGEKAVRWLRRCIDRRVADTTDGSSASMMLSEAEPVAGFVAVSVSEPVLQLGLLGSVLGYLLYLQPAMAAVSIVLLVPQTVLVPFVQRAVNERIAKRIAVTREIGAGLVVGKRKGSLSLLINRVFDLNFTIYKLKYGLNFTMNALHHVGTAAVLGVGGWLVVRGETEIGTVVAFATGLAKVRDPWSDAINWFRDLSSTRTRYALLAKALGTPC
jgi:ABC-type bacteriocin/lantibiotic exporter with double-glycine peptidase domain